MISIGNKQNTIKILVTALLASKKAGEAILEVYNSDFTIDYKVDRSPLTLADRRAHEIIAKELAPSTISTFPVLSEEGRNIPYEERRDWKYFWLVDPLDGTKEFIHRNGEFTVNIAFIHKNRPVLGVIYIPVKDTFYFGVEGVGAYKLEKSTTVMSSLKVKDESIKFFDGIIQASENLHKRKDIPVFEEQAQRITVIGSRSHMSKETENYMQNLKEKRGEVHFIPAGSSLKFCLMAEGKADVYPRFGPTMEWDTAAGQAIVEQAGCEVLSIETSEPLRYNKENLLNPNFVVHKTVRRIK
jgi:3'(2'), 5'-bisphosphate nucleotidase